MSAWEADGRESARPSQAHTNGTTMTTTTIEDMILQTDASGAPVRIEYVRGICMEMDRWHSIIL
jgi:hypothetical protein